MILGQSPRRSSSLRIFVPRKGQQQIFRRSQGSRIIQKSHKRHLHDGQNDKKHQTPISVATPLVFAPKPSSKQSILSLKGTASILDPKWAHLSPCIGAALSTSPLIGNLIKLASRYYPENDDSSATDDDDDDDDDNESSSSSHHRKRLYDTATLANQVFFQIMPESSLFLKRTKSMPAAYLTPRLIGTIVGRSTIVAKAMDIDTIRDYLRNEFDIRSNKIGNKWTGVSLNRWVDLFRLSSHHHHHEEEEEEASTTPNLDWMPLSIWSVALWEVSHNLPPDNTQTPQESWLEYLLECDAHVQQQFGSDESIFRKEDDLAQALKRRDPSAMKKWQEQTFCANRDLREANFQDSMDQLLEIWEGTTTSCDGLSSEDWTKASLALEIVCASVALGQKVSGSSTISAPSNFKKDTTKLSDKPVVPNGYFSVDEGDLKADCVEVTIREIIDLLLWNEDIGAMDLLRLPSTASADLKIFYERLDQPEAAAFDVGQEWFNILSGLPGCDYLAVGKVRGIPYELAPTMDNVARVCQSLVMHGGTNAPDSTTGLGSISEESSHWKSLEDVANGWKGGPPLHVQSDALIHQDASNPGGDSKKYEIATLQVEGNPNCIEIRMRCDWAQKSGFSAVTHLKEGRSIYDNKREETMRSLLQSKGANATKSFSFEQLGNLLALSQNSDLGLLSPLVVKNKDKGDLDLLLLDLLVTRFGCDRRGIVSHFSNSDPRQQRARQQEFDRQQAEQNHDLLRSALHQICDLCDHDRELCKMLLISFLQESGDVVESSSGNATGTVDVDESLEVKIASLPEDILSSSLAQQALWNSRSGIIRGKVLAACAELKSGTISWWDVLLSDFSPSEIISVLALLRASHG